MASLTLWHSFCAGVQLELRSQSPGSEVLHLESWMLRPVRQAPQCHWQWWRHHDGATIMTKVTLALVLGLMCPGPGGPRCGLALVPTLTGNVATDFPIGPGVFVATDSLNDVFFPHNSDPRVRCSHHDASACRRACRQWWVVWCQWCVRTQLDVRRLPVAARGPRELESS